MNSKMFLGLSVVALLIVGVFVFRSVLPATSTPQVQPTPTPGAAAQLPAEKQPRVSLSFTSDGHYVTVNVSNIFASQIEYNLIYNATVKNNQIQTGVSSSSQLNGKDTYSQKQLLGSESSGRFTYHEKINGAVMELTLRDDNGYSVFSASYPFEVTAGKTVSPTPSVQ